MTTTARRQCRLCDQWFKNSSGLSGHMRWKHGVVTEPATPTNGASPAGEVADLPIEWPQPVEIDPALVAGPHRLPPLLGLPVAAAWGIAAVWLLASMVVLAAVDVADGVALLVLGPAAASAAWYFRARALTRTVIAIHNVEGVADIRFESWTREARDALPAVTHWQSRASRIPVIDSLDPSHPVAFNPELPEGLLEITSENVSAGLEHGDQRIISTTLGRRSVGREIIEWSAVLLVLGGLMFTNWMLFVELAKKAS